MIFVDAVVEQVHVLPQRLTLDTRIENISTIALKNYNTNVENNVKITKTDTMYKKKNTEQVKLALTASLSIPIYFAGRRK